MHRARNAAILGLGLIAGSAQAAPNDGFQGRWTIAAARLAPWADPQQAGGHDEERRLIGRTVVIGRDFVAGPSPLGCKHARFASHSDTPDLLFEGGLAEGPIGRRRNARAEARALGITTAEVRTLETSCSEVAYHRVSPTTLMFGLNNRIYVLHPARAGRAESRH
jgi:hypothetical protein